MNEQMNILLEVLEEIKQQNRELKASVSNLASQSISTTTSSEEDGISLTDVARLIGQKIEIDGKFKSELTDVAIVLGKRIREIKDGITKTQEQQAENIASLSKKSKKLNLLQQSRSTTSLMSNAGLSGSYGEYLSYSSPVLSVGRYISTMPIRPSKATPFATASYVWSKVTIVLQSPISTASSPLKSSPTPFADYATKSAITNLQSNAKPNCKSNNNSYLRNGQKYL